jgi:hypothetical protein
MNKIQPHYVDFNTAKLLKEKEFNEHCNSYYAENGFLHEGVGNYNNEDEDEEVSHYSRPEQWQVVEWASLVHNIDIEARPVRYAGDIKTSYYQSYINGCVVNMSRFATKQEALSEAINEFLKMV